MSNSKRFAVVLAGCGVYDGAEIHEATMTLYAIALEGATYEIFAPNIPQHHVVNHITGEEMNEKRNVLVEAARVARGNIKPLSDYDPNNFDALIFPGGFGVAKNLCTFAFEGVYCSVNPEVENAILRTHAIKKPIGALCISPVLLAKVLKKGCLTIGSDDTTANAIEQLGAKHQSTQHGQVAVDKENLLFTTPCYMLNSSIVDIADDAKAVVREMVNHIK
ncbi:MAG TPA: isoprenoid biosynthesis glyoxalase ElbB [Tenuifilaceae bacterium]|nr:isoprenoid biosynthesis glyoxalase ElbB [Tenuifilaceae bacterium]HPE17809.1 isoprenoid biosynthesis glyoxalase ElbB [Tenuifilaceae bacterium]HPJ45294.1 isoprenoid biosynthesis glyoxalase ElbB [Tenuifilaceae bacterium]HPQ33641.1 isoprenoid biosynthesis glyoxalase ElbB [Tenuifilaceae bacterium]HRX67293.1 isoprenoid biosynthesis glyoxalase ElbB [Tenuifilaceae bacterium]